MNQTWNLKAALSAAIMSVFICICAWITVPIFAIPYTLQTFGIFCCMFILERKASSIAVALYVALGALGLPIFSGFQGGTGVIAGPTGGFIFGFWFMALFYSFFKKKCDSDVIIKILVVLGGLLICYATGVVWYMLTTDNNGLWSVITICVVPFIIPDILKMILALFISFKVKPAYDKLVSDDKEGRML